MAALPNGFDRTENLEIGKFEKVCSILNRFGRRPSGLIPILQAIQHEYQYLPEEVLTYVATSLDVPPARVYRRGHVLCPLCPGAERQARHPHLRRHGLPRQAIDFPSWKLAQDARDKRKEQDHARHDVHRRNRCLPRRLWLGPGHRHRRAGARTDYARARCRPDRRHQVHR